MKLIFKLGFSLPKIKFLSSHFLGHYTYLLQWINFKYGFIISIANLIVYFGLLLLGASFPVLLHLIFGISIIGHLFQTRINNEFKINLIFCPGRICNLFVASKKRKPRIHQFTNLKWCKMSFIAFKMKRQGLKPFSNQ